MKLLNELSQTDGTKHMIAECIETAGNYDRIVLFGAGVGESSIVYWMQMA